MKATMRKEVWFHWKGGSAVSSKILVGESAKYWYFEANRADGFVKEQKGTWHTYYDTKVEAIQGLLAYNRSKLELLRKQTAEVEADLAKVEAMAKEG